MCKFLLGKRFYLRKFFYFRVTQSRSFQMLQGWISDSEKTVPTAVPPPSQQQQQQQQPSPTNKSAGKSS